MLHFSPETVLEGQKRLSLSDRIGIAELLRAAGDPREAMRVLFGLERIPSFVGNIPDGSQALPEPRGASSAFEVSASQGRQFDGVHRIKPGSDPVMVRMRSICMQLAHGNFTKAVH